MEKKLLTLILLFFIQLGFSQIVTIPDANFKNALLNHDPVIDTNGDSEIQVSEASQFSCILYLYNQNINNLTGIQAFVNIMELNVGINNLTTLDVSQNTNLEVLSFLHNDIATIDLSANINLREITSNFNDLTTLDVSNNINLELILAGFMNSFTNIDLSNNINLDKVFFGNTQLVSLDVSNNPNLTLIQIIDCPVTTLDITQNPLIDRLLLSGSQIQNIDISQNPLLQYLLLDDTPINTINFENNSMMFSFEAYNCNNLTEIKANNGNNTNIVNFNATSNPNLQLVCVDNLNYATNNFQVDDVAVYSDLCNYNIISGSLKMDLDGNGCTDQNTMITNSVNVQMSHENTTYVTNLDSEGNYQFFTNDTGEFTLSPNNLPSYYTSTPETHTFNFSTTPNTETANFCIEPTGVYNDLSVVIYTPLEDPRPGFDITYLVVYKNVGTTQLSGDVTFEFDDAKLQFLNASETVDSQTTNMLTFNFTDLNPLEVKGIYLDFNVFPPPTTNIDDVLIAMATINPISGDETPENNTFELTQTVIGSYDPNDIRVLQGDEITINEIDKYLNYIIRFQNTGTASAINVRVDHILDDKLDWTTMQLESLSHQGRVETTNGNNVSFIFDNINLPDSTNDEPNSHGYITFKIKPKSDVVIGDVINGVANIFFDFNPPITTNTAMTEIVVPLSVEEFNSNQLSVYPNPTKDIVIIKATQQIERMTMFDINGKLIKTFVTKNGQSEMEITLKEFSKGIYFLKIQTNFGIQTQKIIKE